MSNTKIRENCRCGICESKSLEPVIKLTNFPITGVFVSESVPGPIQGFDQTLMMCCDCSHMQLSHIIPPAQLYGDDYTHRSSASHITPTAFSDILKYLNELRPDQRFRSILEIGCNDLMLLTKLSELADQVVGIDPIWIGKEDDAEKAKNMRVIGNYLEKVQLSKELTISPDIIISTHNLEHIEEPVLQIRRLLDAADDDAIFLIEVPDSEIMVRNLRFDQVFHQHIHYFNISTFLKMLEEAGGYYFSHRVHPGNWGGTIAVAFTKKPNGVKVPQAIAVTAEKVKRQFNLFKRKMLDFTQTIVALEGPVYAYGAAQMLPTLAYHMESNLAFLNGILDDCKFRPGLTYPHIPVRIKRPEEINDIHNATVIITALDAVRPITKRLRDFGPAYITTPVQFY